MRGPLRWLIAAGCASLVFAVLPATALADGPRPMVESESASNVTATDATLEAQINPGSGEDGFSLETTYEFFLESPWCGSLHPFGSCEASGGVLVYKGTIAGGTTSPQLERVDLSGVGHVLSPDTTYGYRVVAHNEVGEAFGGEKTFTTPDRSSPCVEDPQDCNPPPSAPVIESVTVSHITKTDATLEATIDTEGLETEFAFHMISSPCSKKGDGCELVVPIKLPKGGKLFGSFEPQTVSLDLNSAGVALGEGEYVFGVTAQNREGETSKSGGVFEVSEEPKAEPEAETQHNFELEVQAQIESHIDKGGPPSKPPHTTAPAGSSPPPVSGEVKVAVISKPAHGKPSSKHGKRHKHKHHGKKAPHRPSKVTKHK
jgi:hypothetical protein